MSTLKSIWAFPGTLLGKLFAPDGRALETYEIDGAIHVVMPESALICRFLKAIGKAAITLGERPIYRDGFWMGPQGLRTWHEQGHVEQWRKWGPVFFIAYPVAFRYFEKQAERYATNA